MQLNLSTLLLILGLAKVQLCLSEVENSLDGKVELDIPIMNHENGTRLLNEEVSNYTSEEERGNSDKVIVGYYADWKARDLSPEQVPYEKLTHINYAFAIIKENSNEPVFETDYLLPRVVKAAHEKGVKVLLSVGGWTGSKYFSPIAADPNRRKNLVSKMSDLVKQYDLDGIDIDWEFPGRVGMSCNIINPASDTPNFITLLKELRKDFDTKFNKSNKLITLAVRVEPVDGPNGPVTDASELASTVDFVNVMAYDINGPWGSLTGPNAPLRHKSGKGFQLSYMSGVQSWLGARFPSNKIVMGLAFYGRAYEVAQDLKANESINGDSFYVPFSKSIPQGDRDDGMWSDPCPGSPYTYSGVWQWKNLRAQGLLESPTKPGAGWSRFYDQTSHTPWLYSKKSKLLITYDDPQSLGHKVALAKCNNLRGVMIWALHEDNLELLDSIQPIRSAIQVQRGQCESYSKLDRTEYLRASQLNETSSPFREGSFGNYVSINRHAPAHRHKLLPIPDQIIPA